MSTTAPTVESGELRRVMSHVPTGVSVIAAMTVDGPAGLTVGSFVSASLDPPLVGFLVARTSTSWPRVAAADTLCVSVLGEEDHHVCRRLAVSGGDKFAGLELRQAPSGAPLVDGALAWFDCRLEARHEAGDHWFVLARVLDLGVRTDGRPLIFCHGTYRQLGATALAV
jgi:3-hydroxy-9,10-secoandrosta-1,3,5(10)-triene-9,17-dione monooxygenase reductase component